LPSAANAPLSLVIGARKSPLSVAQVRHLQAALARAHNAEDAEASFPFEGIVTTGDQIKDRRLADSGGKGLFTKELDEALLDGRIDIALHCMKDLPAVLPAGLSIICVPAREDVRDAFICRKAARIEDLPQGALVGTASVRRQAQALYLRPDLKVTLLRGNVETRLGRIDAGDVDATFLALAGLNRLGMADRAAGVLDPLAMPPAAGQGALAVVARSDDSRAKTVLAPLHNASVEIATAAERGFLMALDGSCRTPLAALTSFAPDGTLTLLTEALLPDGSHRWRGSHALSEPTPETAMALGREAGEAIRREAGDRLVLS
jgi:hydroxymethylbilane synthase